MKIVTNKETGLIAPFKVAKCVQKFSLYKDLLLLIFDALIQRVFRVIPKIKNYKLVIYATYVMGP